MQYSFDLLTPVNTLELVILYLIYKFESALQACASRGGKTGDASIKHLD